MFISIQANKNKEHRKIGTRYTGKTCETYLFQHSSSNDNFTVENSPYEKLKKGNPTYCQWRLWYLWHPSTLALLESKSSALMVLRPASSERMKLLFRSKSETIGIIKVRNLGGQDDAVARDLAVTNPTAKVVFAPSLSLGTLRNWIPAKMQLLKP